MACLRTVLFWPLSWWAVRGRRFRVPVAYICFMILFLVIMAMSNFHTGCGKVCMAILLSALSCLLQFGWFLGRRNNQSGLGWPVALDDFTTAKTWMTSLLAGDAENPNARRERLANTDDGEEQQGGFNLSYHLAEMSSRFQVGLGDFRGLWQRKWSQMLERIHEQRQGGLQEFPTFYVVLRLFAHKDAIPELRELPAQEVDFYLPQICNFLLHGSLRNTTPLEQFLLELARKAPTVALRLHWYLEAFCGLHHENVIENEIEATPASQALYKLMETVQMQAGVETMLVELPPDWRKQYSSDGADEDTKPENVAPPPTPDRGLSADGGVSPLRASRNRARSWDQLEHNLPEAQGVLQEGQRQFRQQPAQRSFWHTMNFVRQLGDVTSALKDYPEETRTNELRELLRNIDHEYLAPVEQQVPDDDTDGKAPNNPVLSPRTKARQIDAPPLLLGMRLYHDHPSQRGLTSSVSTRPNSQGGGRSDTDEAQGAGAGGAQGDAYMSWPGASGGANEKEGEAGSSRPISEVNAAGGESSCAVDQIDRIVRIHADECVAFSTKERVPFLICMEVISGTPSPSGPTSSSSKWVECDDERGDGERGENGKFKYKFKLGEKEFTMTLPEMPSLRNPFVPTVGHPPGMTEGMVTPPDGSEHAVDIPSSYQQVAGGTAYAAGPTLLSGSYQGPEASSSTQPPGNPSMVRGTKSNDELSSGLLTNGQASPGNEPSPRELKAGGQEGPTYPQRRTSLGYDGEYDGAEESEPTKGPGIFRELWAQKARRIRRASPVGGLPGWRLIALIIKGGDDLRQEQLASQLIWQFDRIFRASGEKLRLRPYNILATGPDTGILECCTDSISLDALHSKVENYQGLKQFFVLQFGPPSSRAFKQARAKFVESLAAYSIVSYLLQFKDRWELLYDANIMYYAFVRCANLQCSPNVCSPPGTTATSSSVLTVASCTLTSALCSLIVPAATLASSRRPSS
jgi:hypothetical protein